jgi:membrane fusion protein, macrolide-specific efflux system
MVKAGAMDAAESPVDLTEELPLDDENVVPPDPPSVWRRYRWPIIGAAVVVIAAAIALPLWLTSGSSTAGGLSVTTVTVSVTTGTIQQTVASSGTIEPASQVNANFAVSGTVTAVDVKAGQTVSAGQVLATVGTTALSDDLSAAQAQLTSAQDKLASDESSGASTSQLDNDQASVTSAESAVSTAQTNFDDASLTSTLSGTVASVNLTVGQQVTGTGSADSGDTGNGAGGSGNTGAGTSGTGGTDSSGSSGQIVIIGTDSYIVNATVDDTQIGQIAEGDQVDITQSGSGSSGTASAAGGASSSSSSGTIYGTVGSISLIGSQSSDVTTFPVVIDVTGDPSGLYAGASANVSIIVKQLNNVTEVPTNAISYNTNGQATVTEVVNGAHVVKDVTVGAAENGETQITSGVTAGDKVLEREVKFTAPSGGGGGIFGNGGKGGFPGGGLRRLDDGGGGGAFPVGGGGGSFLGGGAGNSGGK